MDPKTFRRKLTAVLSADVEGFSRLMDEDEPGTHEKLTEFREIIDGYCRLHKGRMVNTAGDGFLLEFASAVDALGCAVDMQREFEARNVDVPEERQMRFRIGINVGDVIEEGDEIFGDAVNIAARLQALADGGGICISGEAYDQVKKKLAFPYDFLGERRVKNISEPVRIYRVGTTIPKISPLREAEVPATTRRSWTWLLALPVVLAIVGGTLWYFKFRQASGNGKPIPRAELLIFVKKFNPVTNDPEEQELSGRIYDEAIYHLQNLSRIAVTSNEGANADYVLRGSIQKLADEVKVKAYLYERKSEGRPQREYQREYRFQLKDKDAIPENTVAEILVELQTKLALPETRRRRMLDPAPASAYLKFCEGMEEMFGNGDLDAARNSFAEALRIKPNYSSAYGGRAFSYLREFMRDVDNTDSRELLTKALSDGEKAVESNERIDLGHIVLTFVYLQQGQHDLALKHAKQAAKGFGDVGIYSNVALANAYIYSGEAGLAFDPLQRAEHNSKREIGGFVHFLRGQAFRGMEEHERAIEEYRKAMGTRGNLSHLARVGLIVTYDALGQTSKAREVASEMEERRAEVSVKRILVRMPYKDPKELNKITGALKRVGLVPDK